MDNAARARQRVLAVFLPTAAVLYISAEALSPRGTDQVITTKATALRLLGIAAKHPDQLYLAGSLALLALGALAVSYAAIAALVRGRGATLATVAALIGGIGAFCGAITNVLVFPNLAAAATGHLSRDAAARFLVTTFNSGAGHVFLYAYLVGSYAGPALMGLALWRSRAVPRWLAVLFVVGLVLAELAQSKGVVVVLLYTLLFAVAMVLLAVRIWHAAARPAARVSSIAQAPSATVSPDPATTPPRISQGS